MLVDANGNLTDDGTRLLVWDAFNRLVGVARKSDGAPIAAYFYLPDGRRSRKVVYSQTNPGVVERETRFVWDGAQEVEEQSAVGVTEATYVWSPVYVDELVEYRREAAHPLGAGAFYAHQDARCDVVAVTDQSGQVVEKRRYDDFGREEIRDAGGAVVAASPSGLEYGFQGRRRDKETGWVYFRARFYDPGVGRFLGRDPVWDAANVGGWYSFAGNGPVSGRDPSGLDPQLSQLSRAAQQGAQALRSSGLRVGPAEKVVVVGVVALEAPAYLEETYREHKEVIEWANSAEGRAFSAWLETDEGRRFSAQSHLFDPDYERTGEGSQGQPWSLEQLRASQGRWYGAQQAFSG